MSIMLQHKETAPDIDKIDQALDKTGLSPEKKKIVRETFIRYDKALEVLGQ